jgi:hypothetical protein
MCAIARAVSKASGARGTGVVVVVATSLVVVVGTSVVEVVGARVVVVRDVAVEPVMATDDVVAPEELLHATPKTVVKTTATSRAPVASLWIIRPR